MWSRVRRITSAHGAFYVQLAVPMRLPDAGPLPENNLPHTGFGPRVTRGCFADQTVPIQLGYDMTGFTPAIHRRPTSEPPPV